MPDFASTPCTGNALPDCIYDFAAGTEFSTPRAATVLNFLTGPAYIRQRRLIALAVTYLLFIVVGFLTLMPLPVPTVIAGSDKTYHAVAFAALAFPCALLYQRALFRTVPAIVIFGAAIELVQPYAGRYREWADFYADVIGVIIGVSMGLILHQLIAWLTGAHKDR